MRSARLLPLSALLALVLTLGGCAWVVVPVSPALTEHPAPAGVPVTEQTNVSPYSVLSRLGRWNGTTFAPVTAGSIAGGHVIVMTHGWAAGLQDEYLSVQAGTSTLVTMWDPALVDADGQQAATLFAGLAASLQAADPSAAVMMFSWVDQSATDADLFAAFAPEKATEVNGHRMAMAIDQALAPGFGAAGGQLHLIGHSFGANVATTAALSVAEEPRQLTLFDSPEVSLAQLGGAKNDLRYKLTRLDIGRGANQTFVDNYVSLVGEPYAQYPGLGQVVDVRLLPPSTDTGVEKHGFPIGWYAQSASTPGSGVGYWWSPLTGASDASLATEWTQVAIDQPLTLQPTSTPTASNVGTDYRVSATDLETVTVSGDGSTQPVDGMTFRTDEDSLWLTFDASVTGASTAHVFVDGRERWMAGADDGNGPGGEFVILYDLGSGEHTLSLALEGATEQSPSMTGSSATLSNVVIVSADHIQRNSTPTRTKRFIAWVIAVVVFTILMVIATVGFVLLKVVRRARRVVSSHSHQ